MFLPFGSNSARALSGACQQFSTLSPSGFAFQPFSFRVSEPWLTG